MNPSSKCYNKSEIQRITRDSAFRALKDLEMWAMARRNSELHKKEYHEKSDGISTTSISHGAKARAYAEVIECIAQNMGTMTATASDATMRNLKLSN